MPYRGHKNISPEFRAADAAQRARPRVRIEDAPTPSATAPCPCCLGAGRVEIDVIMRDATEKSRLRGWSNFAHETHAVECPLCAGKKEVPSEILISALTVEGFVVL